MNKIKNWIEEKIGIAAFLVIVMVISTVSISTMIYLHQTNNYNSLDVDYNDLSIYGGSNISNISFFKIVDEYFDDGSITFSSLYFSQNVSVKQEICFYGTGNNSICVNTSDIDNITVNINISLRDLLRVVTNVYSYDYFGAVTQESIARIYDEVIQSIKEDN